MIIPTKGNPSPIAVGRGAYQNTTGPHYNTQAHKSAIVSELQLRWAGSCWMGDCPACGYKMAFSLTVKDGKELFFCHACQDSKAVLEALKGRRLYGFLPDAASSRLAGKILPSENNKEKQIKAAKAIWEQAKPIQGTKAEAYLASRGLEASCLEGLRFSPACFHMPTGKAYPALLAQVTRWPVAGLVGIHRTYLKPEGIGKLEHPNAKMMLGDIRGGAVRLAPCVQRVGLAEGIETALSVQTSTEWPMWACLSTSGLQNIVLPDSVREVLICADHDPAGLKAAYAAAERLTREGRRVKIATPPQTDTDFNDMLKGSSHD